MIDFPITDLFDDSLCLLWLERHLHPNGFVCPRCGRANRRLFRRQGHDDAYRCRVCDGYDTLLMRFTSLDLPDVLAAQTAAARLLDMSQPFHFKRCFTRKTLALF